MAACRKTLVRYQDVTAGLHKLGLGARTPVVVHSSLSAFGHVQGNAQTIVGGLLSSFNQVMMPVFTYKTMVVPDTGPPGNGLVYGTGRDTNFMAACWNVDMPADKLMGVIPETLRNHRKAKRSRHPILSFTGVGVAGDLAKQTLSAPFNPLQSLADRGGWVLLMGVDHDSNTSLHLAEKRAGSKQFVRWAVTSDGIQVCKSFPGCSKGFIQFDSAFASLARQTTIGNAVVQAFPAGELIKKAIDMFRANPGRLLCKSIDCGRCNATRYELADTQTAAFNL